MQLKWALYHPWIRIGSLYSPSRETQHKIVGVYNWIIETAQNIAFSRKTTVTASLSKDGVFGCDQWKPAGTKTNGVFPRPKAVFPRPCLQPLKQHVCFVFLGG